MKNKSEIKRLSGKLSYQGKTLDRRIIKQIKAVDRAKENEREAKRKWLASQLAVMSAEDKLSLLFAVKTLAVAERARE